MKPRSPGSRPSESTTPVRRNPGGGFFLRLAARPCRLQQAFKQACKSFAWRHVARLGPVNELCHVNASIGALAVVHPALRQAEACGPFESALAVGDFNGGFPAGPTQTRQHAPKRTHEAMRTTGCGSTRARFPVRRP